MSFPIPIRKTHFDDFILLLRLAFHDFFLKSEISGIISIHTQVYIEAVTNPRIYYFRKKKGFFSGKSFLKWINIILLRILSFFSKHKKFLFALILIDAENEN